MLSIFFYVLFSSLKYIRKYDFFNVSLIIKDFLLAFGWRCEFGYFRLR